jgi:predicted nucleic acid-binding protein
VYWPGREEVAGAAWIYRHEIQNESLAISLQRDLDRGEAESIVLALELEAGLLLMDERDGRRSARRLGLNRVGVVGVLLEAKAKGYVQLIQPLLDALRQGAGFYLGEAVYQAALALAGEEYK